MADSRTGHVSSIRRYQQLQNAHVSAKQQLKDINHAWKMEYDYQIFQEKQNTVIPIPWVWRIEFDWNGFLDVSGV